MSFNSPFSNSDQAGNGPASTPNDFKDSNFNYSEVPAYGHNPDVQPTGRTSTLTIVSFILAILFPLIGLILSVVAWRQAAETGDNRGLAKAGIIVGAVLLALNIILTFVLMGAVTTATMEGTLSGA